MNRRAARIVHLVTRFVASVRPHPIDPQTRAWVRDSLEPGEDRLWESMARADRAESVAVARRLDDTLAGTAFAGDVRWRAAALLHDVGKQASGFGPMGRAAATVVATVLGHRRVRSWAGRPAGVRARIGRYLAHDDIGAKMLQTAGARPEAVAWAGAHHRHARPGDLGIPAEVCVALAAADGEAPPTPG